MASNPDRAGVGTIVAALLLPPLGVFLHQGVTPTFWLTTVLTCLAFVPGMIFALITVLRPRLLHAR